MVFLYPYFIPKEVGRVYQASWLPKRRGDMMHEDRHLILQGKENSFLVLNSEENLRDRAFYKF